jgi:hypothetical protein
MSWHFDCKIDHKQLEVLVKTLGILVISLGFSFNAFSMTKMNAESSAKCEVKQEFNNMTSMERSKTKKPRPKNPNVLK